MNDRHLRVWFVVFVIAVFASGVGAGSLLERYMRPGAGRLAPGMIQAGARGQAGVGPGVMMHRQLNERLQLTADQRQQIDAIFAKRRARLATIRSEINARFDTEQRDFRDEIKKVLTPEQQKKFDEWLLAPPMFGPRHAPGRGMGPGMGRGRGMMGPGRGPAGPGAGGF
jgi:hypothetical protein